MSKLLLFLLLSLPAVLFSKTTKKIKNKKTHETYFVLKSDPTVKHGEYKKCSYKNDLLVKGYYKLGVKDSIWECYNTRGELILKYDYTKKELISYKLTDEQKSKKYTILNEGSADTNLSRPPLFLGGDDLMYEELWEHVEYPAEAKENNKSGKVVVFFTIDKLGNAINYHVKKPLGYGIDEAAIKALKQLPNNWIPGLINGRPVDVEIAFPFIFSLE